MKPFDVSELFRRCATIPEAGCWVWIGKSTSRGYGALTRVINGKKTSVLASRAMYSAVNGPIPQGMLVCHKCDTPLCVNPDHLFLGTSKDNSQDMLRKGRARKARGELNSNNKLTESEVLLIFADTRSYVEIAKDYGVSRSAIWAIQQRRSWAHITEGIGQCAITKESP